MGFTWNKERKKFVAPDGRILQGKEVLDILNTMFEALTVCEYAWSIQTRVFTGAGEDDGDNDSGDMGEQAEVGEVDSPSTEQSVGGRTDGE